MVELFWLYIFLGFVCSLFLGHFITRAFYLALGAQIDEAKKGDLRISDGKWLWQLMSSMKRNFRPDKRSKPIPPGVPNYFTGHFERMVFTLLVGFKVPGSVPAMFGWIALKMLYTVLTSNGSYYLITPTKLHDRLVKHGGYDFIEKEEAAGLKFRALLSSVVSLAFAYLGGWMWQYGIKYL